MFFTKVLAAGAALLVVANGLAAPPKDPNALPKGPSPPSKGPQGPKSNGWPKAPFVTRGRDMVNSKGETVTFAGINWSGHGEAMIPEGLQYQSIKNIVQKVKELDMNVIRLTYAIEMIDDIVDGNDSSLKHSFINALGPQNGTAVLANILKNNPQFKETTTRLEVFDAVARELHKQQIYILLDNHISNAEWCCNLDDGNTWFGDTDFPAANWKRGLAYMANHGKKWPALVAMSLRNELRTPPESSPAFASYGWASWLENMVEAADGVNEANKDTLIVYSGLNYDTDLRNVTRMLPLNANGDVFDISSFDYANKIVFELHNYNNGLENGNCAEFNMYDQGYNAMDTSPTTTAKNIAPVLLTEFGFSHDETTYLMPYAQCIKDYMARVQGGWVQWVLSGSYYVRRGIQDHDETWALLNHDWSDYRSDVVVEQYWRSFVQATLQS